MKSLLKSYIQAYEDKPKTKARKKTQNLMYFDDYTQWDKIEREFLEEELAKKSLGKVLYG